MSVWIYQTGFNAQEDADLSSHLHLPLPFDALPDLTHVRNQSDMQALLKRLHPDWPPETLHRQTTHYVNLRSQLAEEDILVVPRADKKHVALAEVLTPYSHETEGKTDRHYVQVHWQKMHVPIRKIRQLRKVLKAVDPLTLVNHADERKQVYQQLNRPYNRFAKFIWILGVLITLRVITLILGWFNS